MHLYTPSSTNQTNSISKKLRIQHALSLVNRYACDSDLLIDQLDQSHLDELDEDLLDQDRLHLCSLLNHDQIKFTLQLMDLLTTSGLKPLCPKFRPVYIELKESLAALSDLWQDLEEFVMCSDPCDQPEAHELYDLLANEHIRELLVAYNDIAIENYDCLIEDSELVSLIDFDNQINCNAIAMTNSNHHEHLPSSFRTKQRLDRDDHDHDDDDDDDDHAESDRSSLLSSSSDLVVENQNLDHLIATDNSPRQKIPTIHRQKPIKSDRSLEDTEPTLKYRDSEDRRKEQGEEDEDEDDDNDCTILNGDVFNSSSKSWNNKSFKSNGSMSQKPSPGQKQQSLDSASFQSFDETHLSANKPRKSSHSKTHRSSKVKDRQSFDTNGGSKTPEQPSAVSTSPLIEQNTNSVGTGQEGVSRTGIVGGNNNNNNNKNRKQRNQLINLPVSGVKRSIILRRDYPGENLGFTIAMENQSNSDRPKPVIQRILVGSLAERSGNLFPGDILYEINDRPVLTFDDTFAQMKQTSNSLECKLLVETPKKLNMRHFIQSHYASNNNAIKTKRFIRCLFDYDCTTDRLLPAGGVGLSFKSGDVLELIDAEDTNWWQVRTIKDSNANARLIPTQTLEERRQAYNQEKSHTTPKFRRKVKAFFRAADSSTLRLRSDIWSYEEVVPWPPTPITCLLLLGADGVGRRTLKALLCRQKPERFAYPMSDTTDSKASTKRFRILSKTEMENDIRSGHFIEWGKVGKDYYGVRFSEVRKIIASGRTVILDCLPESVYLLHQPEFNPCTVFIGAPRFEFAKSMQQEGINLKLTKNNRTDDELHQIISKSKDMAYRYRHLYTHLLINRNMKECVEQLIKMVNKLENQPGWIPCGWAYELSVPYRSTKTDGLPFIPGSSSLSALGIHFLPASSGASVLARSVLSGISEASSESASRLARPPSVTSEAFVNNPPTNQTSSFVPKQQRLYEKRRRTRHEVVHRQSPIPELDSPSLSQHITFESNKSLTESIGHKSSSNPAQSRPKDVKKSSSNDKSNADVCRPQPKQKNENKSKLLAGESEEEFSSTSSEDDHHL